MKPKKAPRRVTVKITDEVIRDAMYLIRGLGRVVNMVPPDAVACSYFWTVTIENASWPDGPDGEAQIQIIESREDRTMSIRAEIMLPR